MDRASLYPNPPVRSSSPRARLTVIGAGLEPCRHPPSHPPLLPPVPRAPCPELRTFYSLTAPNNLTALRAPPPRPSPVAFVRGIVVCRVPLARLAPFQHNAIGRAAETTSIAQAHSSERSLRHPSHPASFSPQGIHRPPLPGRPFLQGPIRSGGCPSRRPASAALNRPSHRTVQTGQPCRPERTRWEPNSTSITATPLASRVSRIRRTQSSHQRGSAPRLRSVLRLTALTRPTCHYWTAALRERGRTPAQETNRCQGSASLAVRGLWRIQLLRGRASTLHGDHV